MTRFISFINATKNHNSRTTLTRFDIHSLIIFHNDTLHYLNEVQQRS